MSSFATPNNTNKGVKTLLIKASPLLQFKTELIRGADFHSAKLGEKLTERGFTGADLGVVGVVSSYPLN